MDICGEADAVTRQHLLRLAAEADMRPASAQTCIEALLARAEKECRPPRCRIQTALLNLRAQLVLERGETGESRGLAAKALASSWAMRDQKLSRSGLVATACASIGAKDRLFVMKATQGLPKLHTC